VEVVGGGGPEGHGRGGSVTCGIILQVDYRVGAPHTHATLRGPETRGGLIWHLATGCLLSGCAKWPVRTLHTALSSEDEEALATRGRGCAACARAPGGAQAGRLGRLALTLAALSISLLCACALGIGVVCAFQLQFCCVAALQLPQLARTLLLRWLLPSKSKV
jgi:hypothetical protein